MKLLITSILFHIKLEKMKLIPTCKMEKAAGPETAELPAGLWVGRGRSWLFLLLQQWWLGPGGEIWELSFLGGLVVFLLIAYCWRAFIRAGFGTWGRGIHIDKHSPVLQAEGHPRSSSSGGSSSRCCVCAVSPPEDRAVQMLRDGCWSVGASRCPSEDRMGCYGPCEGAAAGGASLLCCLAVAWF